MRWKTANNRRNHPRRLCKVEGHIPGYGYGFAFGGGLGAYEFCSRCGTLLGKTYDEELEAYEEG